MRTLKKRKAGTAKQESRFLEGIESWEGGKGNTFLYITDKKLAEELSQDFPTTTYYKKGKAVGYQFSIKTGKVKAVITQAKKRLEKRGENKGVTGIKLDKIGLQTLNLEVLDNLLPSRDINLPGLNKAV